MTIAEEVFQDLQLLKKYLVNETGIQNWVASFGVGNYALTLSMKGLTKDDEYPGSRFLMAETQARGEAFRSFIRMTPKPTVSMGNICVIGFFVC